MTHPRPMSFDPIPPNQNNVKVEVDGIEIRVTIKPRDRFVRLSWRSDNRREALAALMRICCIFDKVWLPTGYEICGFRGGAPDEGKGSRWSASVELRGYDPAYNAESLAAALRRAL